MRVDIVDRRRLQPRVLQSGPHRTLATFPVLGRCGDVIGVARQAITQHLGIDLGTARLGVFVFFQNHHTRAFAHNKPVTIGVIGAAGLLRVVRAFG